MVEKLERQGRPIPIEILEKPVLDPRLFLYYSAYMDLDAERTHKDAATSIPWSAMAHYFTFYDLPDEICEDFFFLLKKIDAANVKQISEEIAQSYKDKKK